MTKHPEHICRFNDAPQSCDCYDAGYTAGLERCLELLPEELENNFSTAYEDYTEQKAIHEEARTQGFNSCRSQASSAINEEINKSKV